MPFSSDRKWGAIAFHELGAVYLGAPEKDDRQPTAAAEFKKRNRLV